MTDPRSTPLAAALPRTVPFVTPEEIEARRGQRFAARLGANELNFGPSPRALAAMRATVDEVWKYGVATNEPLRSAIAAHHDVPPEAVIVGEGIDGLLGLVVRLFVAQGDAVVTSDGAYPTFNYHVAGFGGVLHKVPFAGDHEDPDALIGKTHETRARLVYLSNPDNPMGSWHSATRVQAMIEAVPDHALMILDEAYGEFAPEGTLPPIDPRDRRVIRMRTFSKAYGMAGARIGYAIGHPEIVRAFDAVRNHFGVSRIAQAGAHAALDDLAYLAETVERIARGRARIGQIATANGLAPLPSATNFVALDCGRDGAFARAVLRALEARGVFVRMPGAAPLDRCIRVSVGTDPEIDQLAATLPQALAAARSDGS